MESVGEPIIAAGGVSSLEHLETLLNLGSPERRLAGVIVGREVTAGRFSLADAKKLIARGPRIATDTVATDARAAAVPRLAPLAKQLQVVADECERAAAHARTAADRMLAGDLDAGLAQTFSSEGHVRLAADLFEDLSKHHSDYAGRRK
jgi:hypothetical protein